MPRIQLIPYEGKYPPLSIYFDPKEFPKWLDKEKIVFAYMNAKPPADAADFNLVYELGLALFPRSSRLSNALIRGLRACESKVCKEYLKLLFNFNVPDYSWDSIPPDLIESNREAMEKVVEWARRYYSQEDYINSFMEALLTRWEKVGDEYIDALGKLLGIEIPSTPFYLPQILLPLNDAYWRKGIWGCDVAPWSRDNLDEAVESETRTILEELIHILTFNYIFPQLKKEFQRAGLSYEKAQFGGFVHSLKEAMIEALVEEAKRRGIEVPLERPPAAKAFYAHIQPVTDYLNEAMIGCEGNIVDALRETIRKRQYLEKELEEKWAELSSQSHLQV